MSSRAQSKAWHHHYDHHHHQGVLLSVAVITCTTPADRITHETASKVHVDERSGMLVVLNGGRQVAVYAPGAWMSAVIIEEQPEAPPKPKA